MYGTLLAIALVVSLSTPTSEQSFGRLSEAWSALFDHSSGVTTNCKGCGARRADIEDTLAASQITALRIELIKQQILEKLLLAEPPRISKSASALPLVLTDETAMKSSDDLAPSSSDDYYGKTDRVIIFPHDDHLLCQTQMPNSVGCFPFKFAADLISEDIATAQLWLYRNQNVPDNETYTLSDVTSRDNNSTIETTPIFGLEVNNNTEGWLRVDFTHMLKNWLENGTYLHAIQIKKDYMVDKHFPLVLTELEHKPFFVIQTNSTKKKHRMKRNVNCAPGANECCRENLYISFEDIGWGDWIIHPPGYHAYYCHGSCSNAASLTASSSHYSSIIRKFISKNRSSNRKVDLIPCCAATHLSSIQLLYKDSDQTIKQKTLPNMVVDSCGCM